MLYARKRIPDRYLSLETWQGQRDGGIVGAGRISHDFVMCVQMCPKEEHEVSHNPPTFKATGDKGSF